jgi:hypothetical protein
MQKSTKTPVKQMSLTKEMKSNIIRASLQKSINEFMLQRSLVADQPEQFNALGKKISAYITVKQLV